jgi:pyruvate dehydrogenase E2 component (dihydrolipoamide acetyltransferase)
MPFTVTMPKLSPTMTEGQVAKWHKKPGDRVEVGDVLLEIATDKATVEHAALDEGYLRKIICGDGERAEVNEPLALFTETADESIEGFSPKKEAATSAPTTAPQVAVPKAESSAPASTAALSATESGRTFASPLAKKLAKEKGIDLQAVQGSGPRGRIMSRDLASAKQQASALPAGSAKAVPTQTTEESLTPMRQVIGQRLLESKTHIPHFYVKQEIDATALVALRDELKKLEVSCTINDLIIKATALALSKHPEINSGYNEKTKKLIRFGSVDICIAVTIAGGLITPILANANNKSLKAISSEAKQLATRAKEGKLQPQEYQGGSFTISNLGMFGVTEMTAIINPPQGAILGVGAVSDAAIVKNGAVVAGKKLVLTISCDHRVIDGAEAAQFLRTLRQLLENPMLFLTE